MFKRASVILLLLVSCPFSMALPNSILGPIGQVNSPLNGQDITDQLLAAGLWSGSDSLPGKWKDETFIAGAQVSHLLARPKVLGEDVVLARSTHRGSALESITVTFMDAGSHFDYIQPARSKEELVELRRALLEKQKRFAERYEERRERLRDRLSKMASSRMKKASQGASRTLRAELEVYEKDGLLLSLLADGHRMIRLTISKRIPFKKSWLDSSRSVMSPYERSQFYQGQVVTVNGDTLIKGVTIVPQGYKPYCGVNTLAMAAHYFGLHIDEDWLAVAGGFQNTGSAGNSNMFRLYNATASEARLKLAREREFDFAKARGLLRDGLPVVVWRRFDHRRNTLHNRVNKRYMRDPSATLPKPDAADRATWPGKKHPVHASVIVGFNDKRKEVLFLESWAGFNIPRRMRYEEMEATATWAFYFRNQ